MENQQQDRRPDITSEDGYVRARREQLQYVVAVHNHLAAAVNVLMAKAEHTAAEEARIERMLKEGCLLDELVQSIGTELGVKLHLADKPALAH